MARSAEIPAAQLQERANDAAAFLKKLANADRLMIACALVAGERSVAALEDGLGIRQPGLSQQLAELREAGLIEGRRVSKSVFYRLADERVTAIVALLYRMFCTTDTATQAPGTAASSRRARPARRLAP